MRYFQVKRLLQLCCLVLLSLAAVQTLHGQAFLANGKNLPLNPGVSSSVQPPVPDLPAADGAALDGGMVRTGGTKALLHGLGFDLHAGLNGFGGDVALPVAQHFNVRVGGEYLRYSTTFTTDGANVAASLHLGRGVAALDWFPFHNGFRVSPQISFAIQTRVDGTVIVPAGETITLGGGDYVSSNADPLRATAQIRTRRSAPGLTAGWGNIAPHGRQHWSFPVDFGFYYIGQPELAVTFQGSACDPNFPQPLGCQQVTSDAGFQQDLQSFIRRNRNNLSYASFFPVASFGVGYRF